jgi:putative flippase GtrA
MFRRYVLLGIAVTLLDYVTTLALATFLHYLVANTIAFLVANLAQFLVAHRWVFNRRFEYPAIFGFYLATLGISAFGLVVSNGLVAAGVDWVGLPLWAAKLAPAAIMPFLNYGLRRWLAYR